MGTPDRCQATRSPSGRMQIFLKTPTGRTITLDLDSNDTAADVCDRAAHKQGLKGAESFRLVMEGKQLDGCARLPAISKGSTLHMLPRMVGGVIEPSLVVLAKKFNQEKKICRICYARLPPRATNCRKKKCGHTNQLRVKRKLK